MRGRSPCPGEAINLGDVIARAAPKKRSHAAGTNDKIMAILSTTPAPTPEWVTNRDLLPKRPPGQRNPGQ